MYPPVVSKGYQAKGSYQKINGMKTYVTGPETATKAILVVYDIFGFFDQTIQGADILAHSNEQKYRVFMPDFFEGKPADISWYPPTTDEHKKLLGNFFQNQAAPPLHLPKLPEIVSEANKLAPNGGFDWSILGFCWGGKIAALSVAGDNKVFKCAAQCHPAMVDPNDAKTIKVPFAMLASKDEPQSDVDAFKANLVVPNHVETFSTQIHGWMAARSDLEDPEVKSEYERGYKTLLQFFGQHARRRSQSEVASPDSVQEPATDTGSGIFHGLFRRKSESLLKSDSSSPKPGTLSRGPVPRIDTSQSRSDRGRDSSGHSDRSRSHPGPSAPRTPGSPEPSSAVSHGEPRQPSNIQDYLEFRLDEAAKLKDGQSPDEAALTKNDIKAIFSGAPHFLLERGKHGRFYPQVIFPWDEHHPPILRMLDRKPLPHASFTLCTLHAHLPVPDDWAVRGGVPLHLHSWQRTGGFKRASFDVGVFEVPNMLANNGREPGTVGYRHFLEFDIADMKRYSGRPEPRVDPEFQRLGQLPATEAFGLMDGYSKPYSQCLSGAVLDRHQLLREGPAAWKRVGVRDINLRTLVQRLTHLRQLRLKILIDGSTMTVLDIETSHELHTILHTQFLYPHPPPADLMPGHPESLKSQIKTLTTVLATRGAWIDFSLPEWRVRAGQVLWEAPPHADGDCVNESETGSSQKPWMNPGMERKWLLVQLLLAAELLIRLDAFVRRGMLHDPHGGLMTMHELEHYERMREGKVNWDLIVARRFLDNLDIAYGSTPAEASPVGTPSSAPSDKPTKHRFSLLESINRRLTSSTEPEYRSAWQCHISSPHIRQQLEGLCVFAENIGWPGIDTLKTTLEQKLRNGSQALTFPQSKLRDIDQHRKRQQATLRPHERCKKTCFVIPGEGISHLLIGTLLENDTNAIEQLGPTANLYGGFIYGGRSWWSKACIVGRVLSALDCAQTCMGWVGSDVLPRDVNTMNPLDPGWFEVPVQRFEAPVQRVSHTGSASAACRPRIKQGGRLALDSTPLGMGDISADAFTLPVDQPATSGSAPIVRLEALILPVHTPRRRNIIKSDEASISFALEMESESKSESKAPTTITLPLRYNVRFISGHECRPPLGFLSHHQDKRDKAETSDWSEFKRLPGHPLHRSYTYKNVSLESLPQQPAPAANTDGSHEVIVIDARGSRNKETFVRAWCASVGSHALIGRVGRTCIACCVREARAINVQVVVRVGDY
ncbi:hypothetical protein N7494_001188 [Penicillium frequentans]|uniref:Dienelactone hydrolase domain-containing protein n=1 Tax=Penicillium frequentans TaxID=3151616 RepID=A0AAD6D7B5_9EURO|nr:hypothetical protein N7494_001188 [Penicillium glabrum]